MSINALIQTVENSQLQKNVPDFRPGDSVKVHARIVEGTKERIQVFEGVVIKKSKNAQRLDATFTVRKLSYNIGVERTFPLHSPRIDKIEVTRRGSVRRARLFYLRPLRGKAARIKTKMTFGEESGATQNTNKAETKTPESTSSDSDQ